MVIDTEKAERFIAEAAELYDAILHAKPSEHEYGRLNKRYADVDLYGILPEIYALRHYTYESRGWCRQRERMFQKARRYQKYCEEVRSSGV